MPSSLSQTEVEAVLALPEDVRYEYFIKQVVDAGKVWGLVSDDSWSLAANGDDTCLALWPDEKFAAACAVDSWSDAVPQSLSLDQFKELLEKLDEQGIKVAVFMTPQAHGQVIAPEELWNSLWACLKTELERY